MKRYYFQTPKRFFQFDDQPNIIGFENQDGRVLSCASITASIMNGRDIGIARFIVDACNAAIAKRIADDKGAT
jgi:hypothetical protein